MKVYLGDGLYASLAFDNSCIKLEAEREAERHEVYLEPEVFEALIQYAVKIGWLKKGQQLQ